jgi:hypothetical protein
VFLDGHEAMAGELAFARHSLARGDLAGAAETLRRVRVRQR